MKKIVIFDLDGTLLDSITDIAESMNEVLKKNNLPTHTIEAYKYKIGKGIDNLVIAALPETTNPDEFPVYFEQMREIYGKRSMLKTRPYDGIIEMLRILKKEKLKLAILSNKPHKYTKEVVEKLISEIKFDCVFGSRDNVPIKPDAQAVFEILDMFKLKPTEAIFVGDTAIDMQTANNAEIESVGVAWGFRTVAELVQADATHIIYKPKELIDCIYDNFQD